MPRNPQTIDEKVDRVFEEWKRSASGKFEPAEEHQFPSYWFTQRVDNNDDKVRREKTGMPV